MAKNVNTNVGDLTMVQKKDRETGEAYWSGRGRFQTLRMILDIEIFPLERAPDAPEADENTPTHRITHNLGNGEGSELGVAWQREITRGDFEGEPMFSIALNHPEMPDWAAQLAAFPRNKNGAYVIQHQRQRGGGIVTAAAGDGVLKREANQGDDIPY